MAYTPVPDVTAGDFGRASWADIVKDDLADHETRIVDHEDRITDLESGVGLSVDLTSEVTGDLPFSNLAQGSALSVLGVTGNATADNASIAAASDHQVLRRSGTAVAFGAVNLASSAAVTGDLPLANVAQGSALSVLGVTGNATADNASIAAASDHQVLRRSGTAVAFGAVNIASSNAITGALPLANLPTNFAQIFRSTTTLTNAQILALPTTPFTLIAAPGASLVIEPLWARLTLNATAGAYTNINSNAAVTIIHAFPPFPLMSYILNDASITNGSATRVSDMFGSAASRRRAVLVPWADTEDVNQWGPMPAIRDPAPAENAALILDFDNVGSGNLTGGNASNSMIVEVIYMVL